MALGLLGVINLMDEAMTTILALTICLVYFLFALYFDLRFHKIPNKLTFLAIISGVAFNVFYFSGEGLLISVVGVLAAFCLLFPAFWVKALAAGDIKLMMGVGAFWGTELVLKSILYSVAVGGVFALYFGLRKVGFLGLKKTVVRYYQCFFLKEYFPPEKSEIAGLYVPFAPALTLGWLWACSQNQDVIWAISNFRHSL